MNRLWREMSLSLNSSFSSLVYEASYLNCINLGVLIYKVWLVLSTWQNYDYFKNHKIFVT